MPPLLSIERVGRLFGGGRTLLRRRPTIHAVREVSMNVHKGETIGIVGESGCGKTTLARLIAGLDAPTSGCIRFRGNDVAAAAKKSPKSLASEIQYVFQDSMAALNPRKTIRNALEAPLIYLRNMEKTSRDERMRQLLEAVGLSSSYLSRYPHELSGGQAQRIGIARALAAEPSLLVLDEPVSALDVSVQAQALNILDNLKRRFALTYLFISHDLSVVESISDRVAVMYFGRIAEIGDSKQIFTAPKHPYTRLLLDSVPTHALHIAEDADAELPDPTNPPPGCAFYARCPRRSARCAREDPAMTAAQPGHDFACHHPLSEKET